jgi:hypothetical protein
MTIGAIGDGKGGAVGAWSELGALERLSRCAALSRKVEAELLAALARVDEERLWADFAYPSLFEYVRNHLGFSESMAAKRIRVARLSVRAPQVLEVLREGRTHLCGLAAVAKWITAENAAEWVDKIAGKTKAQLEAMVSELVAAEGGARPAPRSLLRPLPRPAAPRSARSAEGAPEPAQAPAGGPGGALSPALSPALSAGLSGGSAVSPARRGGGALSGAPELQEEALHRLHATISGSCKAKLERAQGLMAHSVARGDVSTILERALDLLIAREEKRRFGVGGVSGRGTVPKGIAGRKRTRRIPAAVRRAVFERDEGRCAYVDSGGVRCGCEVGVEFHHVVPFARGGVHTAENLTLYCRAHNQRQGERDFGPRRARCGVGARDRG